MKSTKSTFLIALLFVSFSIFSQQNYAQSTQNQEAMSDNVSTAATTIYNYKVTDLKGKQFDFASLKGKKILIVNTASKCGLTPQYKLLESIFKQYQDKNFVIVGFPANNFASQEPGSNEEIETFCQLNYGVTFLMMSKVSVKGDDMCPVYQFLTQKAKNGLQDSEVQWNFQKYLIGTTGKLEKVVSPKVLPTDNEIVKWIVN